MKNLTQQKPIAIQVEDIASVAQRGVERALAARRSMLELSSEQANDVSGGALSLGSSFFLKPIIAGGRIGPLDPYGPFGPLGSGGFGGKILAV